MCEICVCVCVCVCVCGGGGGGGGMRCLLVDVEHNVQELRQEVKVLRKSLLIEEDHSSEQ